MKAFVLFFSVSFFSIFIGSQITEGALLVPYWQSLSATQFYSYYAENGPSIGRFYTVLTIVAALIPMATAIYCKIMDSNALKFSLISTFFALLFIATFYMYFKGTNALFYEAGLSDMALEKELIKWSYWHWGRVFIEGFSFFFLVRSFVKIQKMKPV